MLGCLAAEILLAMQRGAAEGGQVASPLVSGADEQALLKAKVSDSQVLVSCEQNKKEFGLAQEVPTLREDADAIEPIARSQGVQLAGGVAGPGYVTGEGIPVGGSQIRIKLQAVGGVRDGCPGKHHVRAGQRRRQKHRLGNDEYPR